MSKFFSDFKKFINRGNVIDLAVGVVVGGAFGKIVSSLVADIIMPPIGYLLGGVNFSDLAFTIREATETEPAVEIAYGNFVQNVVDFFIISFAIFMMIRLISKMEKKKVAEPASPVAPTKEETLLTEIRDLLKEKK